MRDQARKPKAFSTSVKENKTPALLYGRNTSIFGLSSVLRAEEPILEAPIKLQEPFEVTKAKQQEQCAHWMLALL